MSWDYRIVRTKIGGQIEYGIYEVYYDNKNRPVARTQDPIMLVEETYGDMLNILKHLDCINLDILLDSDIHSQLM